MLLVVGYGSVFGQQEGEQAILKKEFTRIQASMIKDVCNIMGYTNQDVMKKLDQTPFSIDKFYDAFPKDLQRKTTEYCLKIIIGEANDSGKLSKITGLDFPTDYTTIKKFKDNLINAFKKDNLACYTKEDKEAKIAAVNSKSSVWESLIEEFNDDYNNYTSAKETGDWDSYINNSSPNKKFIDLAKKNKIEKEEEEAYRQIQELHSCADTSTCRSFLSSYPNSKYKKQVGEKIIQLKGLKREIYVGPINDEYTWKDGDGNLYKDSGEYPCSKGDSILILHLTITKTQQKGTKDDKSDSFLKELQDCDSWESVKALLDKKEYLNNNTNYKAYAEATFWGFCRDTIGWNEYIDFYGVTGRFYSDALRNIDEARKTNEKPAEITSKEGNEEDANGDTGIDDSGNSGANNDNTGTGSGSGSGGGKTDDGNSLWHIVLFIAAATLIAVFFLIKRKKTQTQPVSDNDTTQREENAAYERCTTVSACEYYLNTYPNGRFVKEVIAKKASLLEQMQKEEDTAFEKCTTVTACEFYLIKYPKGKYVNEVKDKLAKLKENKEKPKPKPYPKQGEWVVVGASVKGNGHIQSNMPCQDNNKFELLGKGWGVAVVSDGAGSAAHSDMGSKVVVERGVVHFKNLIEKEGWIEKNILPSDAEWLQKSYFVLKTIRNEVEMVAKKNNVDVKSLSATCLAVVFSPMGLLVVHVGDGRMGCKTMSGEWKAIMTPHKGEEANQTLFLVSDFWNIPNYVQSGVLVPESLVVKEPVEAFALMSDGCESTAWLCTTQNAETGKYYDQNKPFEGFFNPLEETLVSFHKEQVPEEERKEKWYKFIESGTKGFVKEQDDKTMILGVFCSK